MEVVFQLQLSDDAGSTFETTSYAYIHKSEIMDATEAASRTGSASSDVCNLMFGLGSVASTDSASCVVDLIDPHSTSQFTYGFSVGATNRDDDTEHGENSWFQRYVLVDHDAVRFKGNAGNLKTGTIELLGLAI